jgi:BlaI family transcriptional regulator, penicillinase repressor
MAAPALTELQLSLLKALWRRGEATVQDVQQDLDRPLAQSTVATLLGRMEKRGLVTHRVAGRQYVYRSLVTEPDVQRTVVEELTSLVSHLITARDVNPDDLARVKALIEAKERQLRGDA